MNLRMIGIALLATIGLAHSQNGASASPSEFEVASIKLVNHPVPLHAVSLNISHGTLTMDAAALRQMIGLAYGIQRVRVLGGPNWLDSDLYDLVAKAEKSDASPDDIRAMFQTLLADRFQLKIHRETKVLTVYSLEVGRNGSKLIEAKVGEAAVIGNAPTGGLTVQKGSVRLLVNTLANILGAPVVDKTGLTGTYDFTLQWTNPSALNGPDSEFPSLVTAVQEQLGLRLESQKGPGEILVVDHAEKASAN